MFKPGRTINNELDRDAFLKILMTQLSNQDPMSPLQDSEFISQMAQFSALEANRNMQSAFLQTQAYSMIGHGILAEVQDASGRTSIVVGQADSAGIEQGRPFVMVGETRVWLDDVKQVFDGRVVNGDIASINAGAALIGKWVVTEINQLDTDTQTSKPVTIGGYVTGVTFEDGVYKVMLDNGIKVALPMILEIYNERQKDLIETPDEETDNAA
jgi:flagellar basal-body rod modification protein FlgD